MYLLFDIGGTHTRIGVSRDHKTIEQSKICDTIPDDFEGSISRMKETAEALTGGEDIKAIAGGVAGPMDRERTQLLTAPNLPDWNHKPLKASLEQAFNAPAYLENDTAMIGMGEAAEGAGGGKDIVVYMTVSTGVGGARIVRGAVAPSALGFEPGHQIIDANGPQCSCGGYGHLEALIGGANMERRYGKPPQDITDPGVWEEAARYLAAGLNNVLVFWSPDMIVLGGGMMNSIDIDRVGEMLRDTVTIFPDLPPVVRSQLGENAGLVGAAQYLNERLN